MNGVRFKFFLHRKKEISLVVVFALLVIILAINFFRNNQKVDEKKVERKYVFYQNQMNLNLKNYQDLEEKFAVVEKDDGVIAVSAKPTDDLQKIVDALPEGGIVNLAKGIFKTNLNLSKKVTLIGAGVGTVLSSKDKNSPTISAENSEIKIENLVLQDGGVGVDVASGKAFLNYVKIQNFSATAVYANGSEVQMDSCYVYASGSAVKVVSSRGEIKNSIVKDNKKSGLQFVSSQFSLKENEISGNQSYGVFGDQDSEIALDHNFIQENNGYDVRLEKSMEIYQ